MKYYIVDKQDQLILFKVANELVTDFESKYKDQVIVSGNSIMAALLAFEQSDDPRKVKEMEAKPAKFSASS